MTAQRATAAAASGLPRLGFSYQRVSDPKQTREGRTGLDRQAEAFIEFCNKHGLTPNSDPLVDRGLSAFHGRHRTKGALGAFIAAAEAGQIPPGSVLVVEDLDRFSRERASHGEELLLALFRKDLALGIVRDDVVVDRALYDDDLGLRVKLLTRRDAAHDSSKKLSGRISDVWKRRQRDWEEHRKPYLGKLSRPGWLTDDGVGFVEIHDSVKLIQRIFRLCADENMGGTQIAELLNKDGIKPGKADAYGPTRILNILHDRRVLGEKQWPDGSISLDYFPRIIDQKLWDAAQKAIDIRQSNKGRHGRGQVIANLFQGASYCACGQNLSLQTSRNRQGQSAYSVLRCAGKRKHTCTQPPGDWKYDEEALLLAFMAQRWEKFFDRPADNRQLRALEKRLRETEAILERQQQEAANATKNLADLLKQGVLDAPTAAILNKAAEDASTSAEATQKTLQAVEGEIQQLRLRPSGAKVQRQIKERVQTFMSIDRYDIKERRKFNNWILGLGVRVTVLDPKLSRFKWDSTDAVIYRDKSVSIYSDETLGDMEALGVGGRDQRLEDIRSAKKVITSIKPRRRRIKPMPPSAETIRLKKALEVRREKQDQKISNNPPSSVWPQPEKAWEHVDSEPLRRIAAEQTNRP